MGNLTVTEISNILTNSLETSLGIWYSIILNAFGVIAIACKVVEYQSKKRVSAFILAMASQLLWVSYFVLSGDFISGISCLITFGSVMIFTQREKHQWAKSVWWLVGFLIVQLGLSVLTFKGARDIFPLLAGVTGVVAYYCVDMKKYRAISFFYAMFWLLNSISKGYILALVSDSASLISVSIGIVRYDILKKAPKQQETKDQIEEKQSA